MNDNDIIKALERYADNERKNASCDGCSLEKYFPYCSRECSEDTLYVMWLDLINRQKAEIDKLKLTHALKIGEVQEHYRNQIGRARAEAIREFAKRLEADLGELFIAAHPCVSAIIDNLVEEMMEDKDGNV